MRFKIVAHVGHFVGHPPGSRRLARTRTRPQAAMDTHTTAAVDMQRPLLLLYPSPASADSSLPGEAATLSPFGCRPEAAFCAGKGSVAQFSPGRAVILGHALVAQAPRREGLVIHG